MEAQTCSPPACTISKVKLIISTDIPLFAYQGLQYLHNHHLKYLLYSPIDELMIFNDPELFTVHTEADEEGERAREGNKTVDNEAQCIVLFLIGIDLIQFDSLRGWLMLIKHNK